MPRGGHNRKPTALKVIQGTARKDRTPKNEPKPKPLMPKCPSWLDKEAKREWRRVAPALNRLGLLTEIDGTALAGYCQAYAQWKQATQILQEEGLTQATENGFLVQRPEVGIANTSMRLIRGFCQEFGMTPSARGRIDVPKPDEDEDPFETYLKHGKKSQA